MAFAFLPEKRLGRGPVPAGLDRVDGLVQKDGEPIRRQLDQGLCQSRQMFHRH